jgi:hypothetical protein
MNLLNYSTSIAVEKTIAEIEKILASAGARQILEDFDSSAILIAISFRIETKWGLLSYLLPSQVEKAFEVLKKEKIDKRFKTKEQAARVSWRIIKDWPTIAAY